MAVKKQPYCVQVSDILEPEQERFVAEQLRVYIKKDAQEWEEYFQSTDTVEIKRLSKEEADRLAKSLEGKELSIRVYHRNEKAEEKESQKLKCPRCGHTMEFPDWRCPECFYEFPDFDFEET
jgi:rubrerythrin